MIDTTLLEPVQSMSADGWQLVCLVIMLVCGLLGFLLWIPFQAVWLKVVIAAATFSAMCASTAWTSHQGREHNAEVQTQEAEVTKAEDLIADGVEKKYAVEETSVSLTIRSARAALSKNAMDAPDIRLVTEDGQRATFGVELDNTTGEVTLVGDVGGTKPAQLERSRR